jgi:hypothetical protein
MTHFFFAKKKVAYRQLGLAGRAPGVFPLRDGHLWDRVFAVNEGGAVRPEAAVEPEVAVLAMGYDNENDMIARRE